jgi:DNA-directed RNA polymerase subunit beta
MNVIKKISFKQKNKIDLKSLLRNNILSNNLKRFFNINQLSQLMDETNSLSEISQKKKINCIGSGKNNNNVNLKIREIHSSQYAKICPIQTTEGKNAGLIITFAKEARLSEQGFIETPFFLRL